MSTNEGVGACGNCGSLSPWRCGCPGNDLRPWRERMEDLVSSVFTDRKASWEEVCGEVAKSTGRKVPEFDSQGMLTEDALRHLSDEEVQKVLVGLGIDGDDCGDLCPECFALPGECKPTCGQYDGDGEEDRMLIDLPKTEQAMCDVLDEAMVMWFEENLGRDGDWRSRTFEEAQIMTQNRGLVYKIGESEYQITVVKSK